MYAYIKGTVVARQLDSLIVDHQGIGYRLLSSPGLLSRFPSVGETVTVHTYLYVREDQMALYGFPDAEDLQMFELLLTVSGIGPKVASMIVGTLSPSQFALAVISGDAKALTQVKGIGRKGAERLILELKDKLKGIDLPASDSAAMPVGDPSAATGNDAISALVVLGYSGTEAARAVAAVDQEQAGSLEDVIRLALRQLMRQV